MKLVLTCEHAGNEIPPQLSALFKGSEEVLDSHRGYDPGALDLFRSLQKFASFDKYHPFSRLLVEPNRSLHHPQLFSEFTRALPAEIKKEILESFYFPYRNAIEGKISEYIAAGQKVFHLSIHSFTPQLGEEVRDADIGLLFDPARKEEKKLCTSIKRELLGQNSKLKVRFNYPYLGKADGFTTYLRKQFLKNYAGIEFEINQKFVFQNETDSTLKTTIVHALKKHI